MAVDMQKTGATSVQKFTTPSGITYFSDSTGLFKNIPEEVVPAMQAAGISVAYTANPDSFTAYTNDPKFGPEG